MKSFHSLKAVRFTPLIFLFATIIIASIAATPAQLAKPDAPTVSATANGGEIVISWNPVAGAYYYTVGWVNWTDAKPLFDAGEDWLHLFNYTTVPGSVTSHTVKGLDGGEDHYAVTRATDVVGNDGRFGGGWSPFSEWSSPARPAGQHGAGFCPITGLPLGDDGYLSVGDQVTTSRGNQSFILTGSSTPSSIAFSNTDNVLQLFSPHSGRRFVQVCGSYSHDFDFPTSIFTGWETIMASDAGVGFPQDSTHENIDTGISSSGCETWDVPANAQTAVYAIGLSSYDPGAGVSGVVHDDIGLYRIDLTGSATAGHAHSYAHSYARCDTHAHSYARCDTHAHTRPYRHAQAHGNTPTHGNASTHGRIGIRRRDYGMLGSPEFLPRLRCHYPWHHPCYSSGRRCECPGLRQ